MAASARAGNAHRVGIDHQRHIPREWHGLLQQRADAAQSPRHPGRDPFRDHDRLGGSGGAGSRLYSDKPRGFQTFDDEAVVTFPKERYAEVKKAVEHFKSFGAGPA